MRNFLKNTTLLIISLLFGALLFWAAEFAVTPNLPQSDEEPIFYSTQMQNDLKATYMQALDQAKKSILLMTYTLKDSAILKKLNEKAQEGLDVTVIYDGNASEFAHRSLVKQVKIIKRTRKALMHQKILVIDGSLVWIGSANITNDSLRVHGNFIFGIQSPALAEVIEAKAESMKPGKRFRPFPPQNFLFKDQQMELWFLPGSPQAVQRILDLINTAKKTIKIAMFTWTRKDFAEAVIKAHKRGVDVQVVIDNNAGNGVCLDIVELLEESEVPVRLSTGPGLFHYKMMIVDDSILVNGSANWTKAAFTKNDDDFMILYPLSKDQQIWLEKLWNVIQQESKPAEIMQAA